MSGRNKNKNKGKQGNKGPNKPPIEEAPEVNLTEGEKV